MPHIRTDNQPVTQITVIMVVQIDGIHISEHRQRRSSYFNIRRGNLPIAAPLRIASSTAISSSHCSTLIMTNAASCRSTSMTQSRFDA